jgi:hypothetical protein
MVIMFLLLEDGFYRPLLSRELTFGLKPIFQFTARLCPASEIKFVGASPDFVLTRGHTKHDLAV